MTGGELGIVGFVALLVVTAVGAIALRGSGTQRDVGEGPQVDAPPPANWYPDPADQTQLRYWDGASWTGVVRDRDLSQGILLTRAESRTARHPAATLMMRAFGLLALPPAAWWVFLALRWGNVSCVDDQNACAEAMVFAFIGFPVLVFSLLVAGAAAIWRLT